MGEEADIHLKLDISRLSYRTVYCCPRAISTGSGLTVKSRAIWKQIDLPGIKFGSKVWISQNVKKNNNNNTEDITDFSWERVKTATAKEGAQFKISFTFST